MPPRNGNRPGEGAAHSVGKSIRAAESNRDPAKAQALLPISGIVVGERHRRDMGDLRPLAASMAALGLLHPIVVRPNGTLIAGERRLQAAEQLGWNQIPVTVLDLEAVVAGEFAEKAIRKDFTLSEAVAIKRALEPLEKVAARQRQRDGGRAGGQASGNLPQASAGRAADKAAQATGMARRTLERAEAVVDAAEAEPEKYSKLSNRRAAETFELEVAGLKYSATVGRSPDGRILELFLQNHKNGSQSDANARDSAAAASLALQHGCPLEILQRAVLRDPQGRPATPLGAAIDALTGGSTS